MSFLKYVAGMLSVVMASVVDHHHVTSVPPSLPTLNHSTTAVAPPADSTVKATLNHDVLIK